MALLSPSPPTIRRNIRPLDKYISEIVRNRDELLRIDRELAAMPGDKSVSDAEWNVKLKTLTACCIASIEFFRIKSGRVKIIAFGEKHALLQEQITEVYREDGLYKDALARTQTTLRLLEHRPRADRESMLTKLLEDISSILEDIEKNLNDMGR